VPMHYRDLRYRAFGEDAMEVIHPRRAGLTHRSCPTCGEALDVGARVCRVCGTEVASGEARAAREPGQLHALSNNPMPAPPPSARPRRRWALIIPLIAAGFVIAVLGGWLVLANANLDDKEASLKAAKSRTAKLDRKVESMASQIDSLEDEKTELETQNTSLNSAMIDCKDAANATRRVFRVGYQNSIGNASIQDYRDAWKDAGRAWILCRAGASSNGAI
jgi:cell division protein FtsB